MDEWWKLKTKSLRIFQNEKCNSLDSRIPINTKQKKKKKNQDKLYAKRQKSSQRVKKHNYLEGNMNETKNWLLDQKIV